jgi:hypothetical protein
VLHQAQLRDAASAQLRDAGKTARASPVTATTTPATSNCKLMGIFAAPIYALRGTLRHYALDWNVGAQSDGQYCSFI